MFNLGKILKSGKKSTSQPAEKIVITEKAPNKPGRSFLGSFDLFAILSFILPFFVYMLTLAPSVTFFDSGEFLTAASSLGSAHSPGYALFLMFVKPFTFIPLGNIAFRINMATAFSSSAACLGVYLLTRYLLQGERLLDHDRLSSISIRMAALAAALSFSVTPRLWLQSNHDKPYPLLAFITAIIFYLLFKWRDQLVGGKDMPSYIYASAFLAGMATSAHQTLILFVPAWALFILLTDWKMITRGKELILAAGFGLFGFSVHLYLPLRATVNPLLNWGDPKSSTQFLWHFLRKGYYNEPPARNFSLLWAQLKAFSISHEFTWLGMALVLLGLFSLWKRQRNLVLAFLLAVATFLLVIAGYFNTPLEMIFLTEEFFTPLYLLSAVLVGLGLYQLLVYGIARASIPPQIGAKVYALVAAMFFALPLGLCAMNYYENDQHNNYIAYDYASNSLRSLRQDAVMFTWGDSGAFPLWYLQGVERMREDVDLPHTPHLVFDWYLDSLPRVFAKSPLRNGDPRMYVPEESLTLSIADLIGKRPVYIDFSTRYSVTFANYVPSQKGIVYQIRKHNEPAGLPDVSVWDIYNSRGILEKISFLDLDTGKAIAIYANGYLEAGEVLMSVGHLQEGKEMLRRAERVSPEMQPAVKQILLRYGGGE